MYNGVAGTTQEQSPPQSAGSKRFFSDLHPEATFLSRSDPGGEHDHRPNDDIGVWVDKREWEALLRHKDVATAENGSGITAAVTTGSRTDQKPHSTAVRPLLDVYFRKINPILPLLDEPEFRHQYEDGVVPAPLVHALCLVAAKDAEAERHLRLCQSPSALPPREFCSGLHACVMGALRAPVRYDKVTLIKILALASMHNEGADVEEEASMLLSQALHHAQTLGIHLGQHSSSPADLAMKRLFWSLYALDRLNSTMNGRPIIMSDIDIAIEPFAPGESGFPAFEAWLRITDVLNKIIAFYRPHVSTDVTGWEDRYPGLEEILDEVGGWQLEPSVHATIHLFYLSVAILSHRSRGIKQIPRSTHSNVRQRLCASEVVRLMESTHGRDLHALHFIPYAVSLALSVAYQHLRQSQFQHQQEDACQALRECSAILQALRRTWSSADTMAALAKKVLDELDRAPSLATFRVQRASQLGNDPSNMESRVQSPCMPAINGDRTGLKEALPNAVSGTADNTEHTPVPAAVVVNPQPLNVGINLFDGMDDIFGTYLDPNYPNVDDMSFVDELQPFDWNEVGQQ